MIVFFSSTISVLFYLGWMQVIIKKVAWIMQICMGTTAGESLNAAGNIFIGQVHMEIVAIYHLISVLNLVTLGLINSYSASHDN